MELSHGTPSHDFVVAVTHRYEFPAEERRKLREYFQQSQHLNRTASYQRLTARMSPKLQVTRPWSPNPTESHLWSPPLEPPLWSRPHGAPLEPHPLLTRMPSELRRARWR